MTKHSYFDFSFSIGMLLILVLAIPLFVFLCEAVESFVILRLKFVCTAEVTGVVDEMNTGFVRSIDQIEIRHLNEGENKAVMRIAIEPDGVFSRDVIYANPGKADKIGSKVTIHYSPKEHYDYYINSWIGTYKNTGNFSLHRGLYLSCCCG